MQSSWVKIKRNYTVQWVEGSGLKFCFCVLLADSCSFQMLVCCQLRRRGNPTERVMGRQPQGGPWPSRKGREHARWAGGQKVLDDPGQKGLGGAHILHGGCKVRGEGLSGAAGAGQNQTVRLGNTATPSVEEVRQLLTALQLRGTPPEP